MVRSLWRWSPLVLLPLLIAFALLSINTGRLYLEVGVDQIGDRGLLPLSLKEAGRIEFDRLTRNLWPSKPKSSFRSVSLFVHERELDRLNADLPLSGVAYVPATVFLGDERFDVKVRYRGDYHIHWGFPKKSFRIKTKRKRLMLGMRHINLVVPKTAAMLNNLMSYRVAKSLGLLVPHSELVTVNLNGEYQGLYLLAEQVNEGLLRRQHRLPGDIYTGDQLFGRDRWSGVGSDLFASPGLWDKSAVNNKFDEDNRAPLRALLAQLQREPGPEFNKRLRLLLDFDAFARFSAMETLLSTAHHDSFHNWKLYFDPVLGRFEPLVWDSYGWNPNYLDGGASSLWVDGEPPQDIIVNRLMNVLHQIPEFVQMKRRVLANFFEQQQDRKILSEYRTITTELDELVRHEALAVDSSHRRIDQRSHRLAVAEMQSAMERIFDYHRAQSYSAESVKFAGGLSPQFWSSEITIETDTTITDPVVIAAGSTIKLGPGVKLTFRNRVTAEGTETSPIVFSAMTDRPWGTVLLKGSDAEGSVLSHVRLSGGSQYVDGQTLVSGMLSIYEVPSVTLSHCLLADNHRGDDMLHVVYSSVVISQCVFENANMDAVDLDVSEAEITDSIFENSGNDGLDLMDSTVQSTGNSFSENRDKGISVGEGSHLEVVRNRFTRNTIGLEVKDGSIVDIQNSEFINNRLAVNLYKKNWYYGAGGQVSLCHNSWWQNDKKLQLDDHSSSKFCDDNGPQHR